MAGKKIKGRKRHNVTDTMGNLLAIVVHAANIHDTKSGINPAAKAYTKYPTIQKFCGDDGYRKSFEVIVGKYCVFQEICYNMTRIQIRGQKNGNAC